MTSAAADVISVPSVLMYLNPLRSHDIETVSVLHLLRFSVVILTCCRTNWGGGGGVLAGDLR